ncbi:peptide transporter [Roseomonas sp. NAR14]|uniref:Peptide transporter n=1 Tax=Roseomonas acroporae TaxID=2937791 RepID=A0A9X1Y8T6_9PROT|nr:peptide transporter [Roseomonas acroporae]MCK8784217.1 peptide transporter [Roseomonas acroporae]
MPPGPAAGGRVAQGAAQGASQDAALREAIDRLREGGFAAAARLAEPVYHARPTSLEPMLVLGLALGGCGHPDLAADLLDEVARRRPDAPHPAADLLGLLGAAGREEAAADYLAAAGALAPRDPTLALAAGDWARSRGRAAAAREAYGRALALRPGWSEPALRLSSLAVAADEPEEAVAVLEAALAAGPPSAELCNNLGVLLAGLGRLPAALARFEEGLRLAPDLARLRVNRAMALLKAGRRREGWAEFEWRLRDPGVRRLLPEAPLLTPGVPLAGRTVLVTYDSGFGDTIQFARYLPRLRAAGASVLLWVPTPLGRLLADVAGADSVLSGDMVLPRFDWHCPIMRLPLVLGEAAEPIPAAPYLKADPALAARWAGWLAALPAGRRIGLVWAGSARAHDAHLAEIDARRSLDAAALAPLGAVPGLCWVGLQHGDGPRARQAPPGLVLHDPMGEVRDFADTAAIIAGLEAVVSVDTSVAHLAGAMGRKVLLLDRHDNCWRWLTGREDSPWYPTLRIFRQERWGEWGPVVARVAAALGHVPPGPARPDDPGRARG